MKKGRSVILGLSIAALTLGGFGAGVYAYSQIKLVVNGKNISTPIEVMDGTSYVPLRAVSEALGAQVTWDEHTQTVEISRMPGSPVGAAASAMADGDGVYPLKLEIRSGPMRMTISKITVTSAYQAARQSSPIRAVVLEVRIENTSQEEVHWNVKSGSLVLNTKEYIPNALFPASGDVDGVFGSHGIKEGNLVFELKEPPQSIHSMTYILDEPLGNGTDVPTSAGPSTAAHIVLSPAAR